MKPFSAFARKGRWYRGCCHTHTTLSDGKLSPQALVDRYRRRGYDFVVLTDHGYCHSRQAVRALQRPGFLVINGAELHPPTVRGYGEPHHLAVLDLDEAPREAIVKRGAEAVIRWAHRRGAIVVYAHPYWSGHDIQELQEGRAADGVEVFNSVCELDWSLGDSNAHIEQALGRGIRWKLFASDDTHGWRGDLGRAWIMVKAPSLTKRSIMGAIRRGFTYASTGPRIKSLSIDRTHARVTCSPCRRIMWRAPVRSRGMVQRAGSTLLTQGDFPLKRIYLSAGYLRCEVTDAAGRKAWSNMIRRNPKTGAWED